MNCRLTVIVQCCMEAQVSVSAVTRILYTEKCWSAKWLTQLDFGQPYSCFARKMADGRLLFLTLYTCTYVCTHAASVELCRCAGHKLLILDSIGTHRASFLYSGTSE